jgi:hypothetical protein
MGLQLPSGTTVTVETKWFPPVVVDLSGNEPPSVSGQVAGVAGAVAVKVLRPRITIKLAGTTVKTWQPAGSPDPNAWDKTKIALLVAAAVVAYKVVRIIL